MLASHCVAPPVHGANQSANKATLRPASKHTSPTPRSAPQSRIEGRTRLVVASDELPCVCVLPGATNYLGANFMKKH